MSSPNTQVPSKPPHKKLQNDVAGIDLEFGSIYVIPGPTDYIDDDYEEEAYFKEKSESSASSASSRRRDPTTPHQLVTFGPNQEKVLIIPDYRVNKVVPGVSIKPLIGEDRMIKTEKDTKSNADKQASETDEKKKEENPDSKVSVEEKKGENKKISESSEIAPEAIADESKTQPFDSPPTREQLTTLISIEARDSATTINKDSAITTLAKFQGPEGVILLDMFEGWGVKTLEELALFPSKNEEAILLLRDADMFADVELYCSYIAQIINLQPSITIPGQNSNKGKLKGKISRALESKPALASRIDALGDNDTKDIYQAEEVFREPRSIPLDQISSITEEERNLLYRYALISTVKDLQKFPKAFPGVYGMLKLTNEIPKLDEHIASASALVSSYAANQSSIGAPRSPSKATEGDKLSSSQYLKNLGEVQSPQTPIDKITGKTLLGAIEGMPLELAGLLAAQYPPVTDLASLATFAEVSPTEYTYLLRQYPELPGLCQQASLLVSVAHGRRNVRK